MQAHPAPARRFQPCPGCITCRRDARRDRLLALAIYGLLGLAFVVAWIHGGMA